MATYTSDMPDASAMCDWETMLGDVCEIATQLNVRVVACVTAWATAADDDYDMAADDDYDMAAEAEAGGSDSAKGGQLPHVKFLLSGHESVRDKDRRFVTAH